MPARLVRPKRASRWQRGGSGADSHVFGATALFDAAIDQWKDNLNRGNEAADTADFAVAVFDTCPNCGAATWTERRAPRRRRPTDPGSS